MIPRTIPPRTLTAYRNTRYQTVNVELRVGRRSPAMDGLMTAYRAREAVLVTAHNPFSRIMPARWNHRMQSRLARAVARRPTLPAVGILRRWSEVHLLVLGDARPIRKLARRFRQNGIVILRRGQPVRLDFLVG